jgi:iron complex outermembrane receptor protein
MKKLLLLLSTMSIWISAFAQETISGVVKDQDGAALVGAVVHVKHTKIKAVTDAEGKFTLSGAIVPPYTLEVKSFGYKTYTVVVNDLQQKQFDVVIEHESVATDEVVVTARRRKEVVQDIPIPITVIGGQQAEDAGAFNVNRLKELVPTVQLYTSNARNTTLNIRGLGSTFGLTNDGIDPGVGFYVDGVYHARPAATALDFIDVDQIEILRGPQGTLFGKNTTAGAFNITTKKPSNIPSAKVELSYGNYNFIQAKTSVTGPLAKNLSTRLSFSGTQRQGTIFNPNDQQNYNGQNNLGFKGQLYYTPSPKLEILFSADQNIQRPDGASLVVAGITTTERSAHRQYAKIISDLGYKLPTIDPFARRIYTNTPWRHDQEIGGLSLNVDYRIGKGTLTSTTAWRYWNWKPVNDRDFTEVAALTKSQADSRHDQYSQEIRYAGNITEKLSGVVGVYALSQTLQGLNQTEETGKDQWRFVQTSASGAQALFSTPGLLDNFGIRTNSTIKSLSTAAFAQADWEFLKGLHILPGVRFTYDKKDVDYDRKTYGGLQTNDAALLALKKSVYSDQYFTASTNNNNLSGNITLSYRPSERINTFVTYSTGYKPVGVNVGGLPNATNGRPDSTVAVVKPEYVQHYELGIKTKPFKGAILNVTVFNTDIKDYQTNVQSPQLGVNRGYLANAEEVNVKGLEIDGSYQLQKFLTINAALAYTDGKYVTFKNAPLPLEETGHTELINNVSTQVAFKDASGGVLPGISKWNVSIGAELSTKGNFLGKTGRFFIASDFSHRSEYSSNPTPSKVLTIDGYSLVNGRVGFRADDFTFFVWGRNIGGTNYFEQLQAAAGNSGLYAGVLGDPRTYGVTVRYSFK